MPGYGIHTAKLNGGMIMLGPVSKDNEYGKHLAQPDQIGSRGFMCRDPEGHIWNVGTYDPWQPSSC